LREAPLGAVGLLAPALRDDRGGTAPCDAIGLSRVTVGPYGSFECGTPGLGVSVWLAIGPRARATGFLRICRATVSLRMLRPRGVWLREAALPGGTGATGADVVLL
jgi:hypothetical protein